MNRTVKVLVTGANGFLGSAICRAILSSQGLDLVALHREGADLSLLPTGATTRAGDFTCARQMQELFAEEQPTAVVHAAAIVSTGVPNLSNSLRVNVEGTRTLAEVAGEAGCRRWVQVSSMSAHPANKSVYGGTKFLADQVVMASPLDWTVLRPSLIYGEPRRGIFHRLARLLDSVPIVPMVGAGSESIRPVHRDDVATACISALEKPETVGGVYMLGGPEETTFRDVVVMMRRTLGRSAILIPIPIPLCRIAAIGGELLFEDPPMTTDNLEGLSRAPFCDPADAIRALGFSPRAFRKGFEECLAAGLLDKAAGAGV